MSGAMTDEGGRMTTEFRKRFKPYPAYKDSGVEWLGKIPEHWELTRIKLLARVSSGLAMPDSFDKTSGEFPVYGSNGPIGFCDKFFVSEETIAVGRVGASGSVNVVPQLSWVSDNALLLQHLSPAVNLAFLRYLLETMNLGEQASKNAQPIITGTFLGNRILGLPSLSEQHTIAFFLDRETAKIDALVAKKERLIELFQEKRTALISRAVTKGLDPKVPMKDSGVEWLGEIPAHWYHSRIKHVKNKEKNAFVDGPFGSNLKSEHFVVNGDVYVIESEFAVRGTLNTTKLKKITYEHFETIRRSETKGGDLVLSKIGANFGMNNILPELDAPAVVSGNSMKLTVDTERNSREFLHFQLLHLKWSGAIDLLAGTTAQPALSLGSMSTLPLALPPLDEQLHIVRSIRIQKAHIEQAILKVREAIDRLKEYRTALISAAVTGKIDVRKEAAA